MFLVRLQKYLAGCGVASRRKSEDIIRSGRVSVNGEIVREMGVQIDEENDVITLDGSVVKPEKKMVYVMLNKPAGFVTTASDEKGRQTVMDLVADIPVRIYPVGRLDYDTEGLLLMTNDGDLTYKITHPKNNVEKTYVAEVAGNMNMGTITSLRNGVYIDGVRTSPAKVEVLGATQLGTKMEITIHEGRNRQVRRMFEAVGCKVKRLKRTKEAGLNLGHVPLGRWRKLTESEVNMLKKIGTGKKSSRENRARYMKNGSVGRGGYGKKN
ncbi:MAG TPA: rRNA pseudouridine synthase [Firmicutes bacterium]|nr:rRNA pseudouridine synthase [Bacillota bacterium]